MRDFLTLSLKMVKLIEFLMQRLEDWNIQAQLTCRIPLNGLISMTCSNLSIILMVCFFITHEGHDQMKISNSSYVVTYCTFTNMYSPFFSKPCYMINWQSYKSNTATQSLEVENTVLMFMKDTLVNFFKYDVEAEWLSWVFNHNWTDFSFRWGNFISFSLEVIGNFWIFDQLLYSS